MPLTQQRCILGLRLLQNTNRKPRAGSLTGQRGRTTDGSKCVLYHRHKFQVLCSTWNFHGSALRNVRSIVVSTIKQYGSPAAPSLLLLLLTSAPLWLTATVMLTVWCADFCPVAAGGDKRRRRVLLLLRRLWSRFLKVLVSVNIVEVSQTNDCSRPPERSGFIVRPLLDHTRSKAGGCDEQFPARALRLIVVYIRVRSNSQHRQTVSTASGGGDAPRTGHRAGPNLSLPQTLVLPLVLRTQLFPIAQSSAISLYRVISMFRRSLISVSLQDFPALLGRRSPCFGNSDHD